MDITELLQTTIEKGATDLHLTKDSPPMLRINGDLIPVGTTCLTGEDTENMAMSILSPRQREVLEREQSVDLAYSLDGTRNPGRFRINAFHQKGSVACAIRRLSDKILDLEELGLPRSVGDLCDLRDGLILVTGVTGSGKTTTLASMVDRINSNRACHIITIEDPIEYIHRHKKAIVNQREVHTDVPDFANSQICPERGPGSHPCGRDAGPGDHQNRDYGGRDRPSSLCYPPYPGCGVHCKAYHRRIPGRGTVPDKTSAFNDLKGSGLAEAG
jgi:twitching motility protein PilT